MSRRITFILAAVCVLCGLVQCQRLDDRSGSGPESTKEVPEQESWNSRIILSDKGETTAIIRAGHIRQFEKRQIAEIDSGLTVDFYARDGTHASVLTAENGLYDRKTQDMRAVGSVMVISDSGDTLRAEELRWNNTQRKILADGPVRISNPQGVQTGVGLRSSANLEDWTLNKVTGKYEGKLD